MQVLSPALQAVPHLVLVINSSDFMHKPRNVKLPDNCGFLKLDINDIYMGGTHSLLANQSSIAVDSEIRGDYCLVASAVRSFIAARGP